MVAATTDPTNLAAIFGRVWEGRTALSAPLARHVLKLGFIDSDVARMRELTAKNRTGELTAAEASELDAFVRVGDLLAVLQSKARVRLRAKPRVVNG